MGWNVVSWVLNVILGSSIYKHANTYKSEFNKKHELSILNKDLGAELKIFWFNMCYIYNISVINKYKNL